MAPRFLGQDDRYHGGDNVINPNGDYRYYHAEDIRGGALKAFKKTAPDVQVVLMTGMPTVETACECVRAGAFDYLTKPVSKNTLVKTIKKTLKIKKRADEKNRRNEESRLYKEKLEHLVEKQTLSTKIAEKEYQTLFFQMHSGFALHEIICDEEGQPIDYRYLTVNPAFEEMTGLQASAIVGKTALEVQPETEQCWIENYGQVAVTGKSIHFKRYNQEIDRYFEETVYSPARGRFACGITNVTDRRRKEIENE